MYSAATHEKGLKKSGKMETLRRRWEIKIKEFKGFSWCELDYNLRDFLDEMPLKRCEVEKIVHEPGTGCMWCNWRYWPGCWCETYMLKYYNTMNFCRKLIFATKIAKWVFKHLMRRQKQRFLWDSVMMELKMRVIVSNDASYRKRKLHQL